jgi:hypothetical protein
MIKVYVDTSVVGGCFDVEFEEWSNKLIEEFKLGLKRCRKREIYGRCTAHRNSHSQ